MTAAYRQTVTQVLEDLGASADEGLTSETVHRRRDRDGANRLRKTASRPTWRILVDQLTSIVVILLLAASGAALAFGRVIEAAAIAAAVLVNTVIGFAMELRATRAMEALQRMGKTTTHVRRDGRVQEVAADALVRGDIVLLEAGDVVTADLRLIEANRLQCDEAALTGESLPVDKDTEPLEGEQPPIGERRNMAYKGTAVTRGSGSGVVVAVGMDTELGHISSLVEQAEQSATPLEKRLDSLGRRLIWLTLVVAAVVAGTGLIAGKELLVMLETAIALAIAAVPEGLPVVATLALAQGMHRMAKRNAVVKQLSAVETLGAANLIFTDKTGTLTENHMTVARLALARGDVEVEHDDDPGFAVDHRRLHPSDAPVLRAALEIGTLCNNASVEEDGAVGDPTEVSLLEAAVVAGIGRPDLLDTYPEVREIGFDPDLKMMATVHEADGNHRFAVKGAPEAVLGVCARVLTDDGTEALDDDARERWRERGDALAADGLRVLALAEKTESTPDAEPYDGLTLVALAGLYDPPRQGIAETVTAFRDAGIRVVMGTGDHAATAQAIAAEIGLAPRDEPAVQAAELDRLEELGDDERRKLLERRVFARISPEQKLRLIGLYQKEGRIVGMTGDGVNDAPALKKADIGIAMGKRGTEVAREAADVVLKDDALSTLVAAVEHGRTIFRNIRRFIVYLLSGNLGEIMAVSAAAIVAAPLPLLPLQILYINFVSDVMPALALGLSPSRRAVMHEPPRDPHEPILLRRHWIVITVYGALLAAAVLAAFALGLLVLGLDTAQAVTVGFLTFGFARLWHVLNMRGADSGLVVNEITLNPVVWLSIAIGVVLLLASVYLPLLSGVLSTRPPSADGWLLIAGFSLAPLIVVQAAKTVSGRWGASNG